MVLGMVTMASTIARKDSMDAEPLLIVCCGCKRLRVGPMEFVEMDPYELWQKRNSISHTLCPECANRHYGFSRKQYASIACRSG